MNRLPIEHGHVLAFAEVTIRATGKDGAVAVLTGSATVVLG